MTKRVTLDETFMITDNECLEIINPLMNSKDVAKVCELLNELHEENEELRKEKECDKQVFTKKQLHELLQQTRKENEQLKEENEFAKLLANHRGEMVSFADSLIQDVNDELTQKMWYQFKEELYQKWKKKRGIE